MQRSEKTFIIEIKSAKMKARRKQRIALWQGVDLAKAMEAVKMDVPTGSADVSIPSNQRKDSAKSA